MPRNPTGMQRRTGSSVLVGAAMTALAAAVLWATPAVAGAGAGAGDPRWGCGQEHLAAWYDAHNIGYETTVKDGRRYVVQTEQMHREAAAAKGVDYDAWVAKKSSWDKQNWNKQDWDKQDWDTKATKAGCDD